MNQHPFPATNVQYSPLLAVTERVQSDIQRAGGKKVERGINQSNGEKWLQIKKKLKNKKKSGRMNMP